MRPTSPSSEISAKQRVRLFVEAGELLSEPDEDGMNDYARRVLTMTGDLDEKIVGAAQLGGTGLQGRAPSDLFPIPQAHRWPTCSESSARRTSRYPNIDYLDDGTTDVTDD